MTDIVERLLTGTPGGDSTYPVIMTEAAKTIESLRAELAKVNMEVDRITRTNQAKREHRDKLLKATAKQADEIERLRAALREIAKVTRGWEPGVWSEEEGRKYFSGLFFSAQHVARAALGGSDD